MKYIGFDIPNEFVIGYGLDYAERYRDLPYIATLKPEVYRADLRGLGPGGAIRAGSTSAESRRAGAIAQVARCTFDRDDAAPSAGVLARSRRRRPRTIRRVDGPAGQPGARHRCMERKKIFRSVWFWVVLVVLVAAHVLLSASAATAATQEVRPPRRSPSSRTTTSSQATINDKEQTLDLELKNAVDGSDKITTSYPLGASDDIFDIVSGTTEGTRRRLRHQRHPGQPAGQPPGQLPAVR